MILVTGATGFIGRALVRHLSQAGQQVRVLLRPSPQSPRIPQGVPVEVAVVSLNDERGVRAALRGVDQVYHLASATSQGRRGNLLTTDIEGTRNLAYASRDAGIGRLIFLSHIGADRALAPGRGRHAKSTKSADFAVQILRRSGACKRRAQRLAAFASWDKVAKEPCARLAARGRTLCRARARGRGRPRCRRFPA